MQSTAMSCLGRAEEAWAARIESFRWIDAEGYGDRLPVTLGGAARMELHAGRLESARAFLRLEVEAVRDTKNQALLTNALVHETLLQVQLDDHPAAARAAHEAMSAATSLSGPARELAVADANLAAGAAALHGDAAAAHRALTSAIDFYRASKRAVFLPQAHLLRARAALRGGDSGAALRDLTEGMDVLERHRLRLAGPLVGADILDAGVTLGRESIRLRLETGDVAGAFREAERRNLRIGAATGSPVTLDVLQRRLAGTSTAVLMLAVLPGEAVAIAVTERTIATARGPLDERTLDARIRGAGEGRREDAEALYDALLRPSAEPLSTARRLIVVAEPLLRAVPYAALYDRAAKRYLVEALPVAVAESASTLVPESDRGRPRSIVAVLLPAAGRAGLPDATRGLVPADPVSAIPRTDGRAGDVPGRPCRRAGCGRRPHRGPHRASGRKRRAGAALRVRRDGLVEGHCLHAFRARPASGRAGRLRHAAESQPRRRISRGRSVRRDRHARTDPRPRRAGALRRRPPSPRRGHACHGSAPRGAARRAANGVFDPTHGVARDRAAHATRGSVKGDDMPSVNVSFLGVCTIFQNLPELVPPGTSVPPHRVVLVKNTTRIRGIDPHIAKLQLVADDIAIDGPGLPPAGEDNIFLLQGVTLTIANPVPGGPPFQPSLGCLPSLQSHLQPPEQLGPPAPLVTIPDPDGAAAWFDVITGGNSWIAYLLKPDPPCPMIPSISILGVDTVNAPQLLVTPWDGSPPTTFTLTRTGTPPDINVMNFADGKGVVEDNRDFLLNYLTAATFPPIPSVQIPLQNVCTQESPGKYRFPRCGDAGPGCSNTQFP